mmetsp:Transcript_933/g.4226  ORF Transcript_933/g.4226 Transcript_933/m.4226 type:complete len:281 (+) Transcript_933:726-1568(+)
MTNESIWSGMIRNALRYAVWIVAHARLSWCNRRTISFPFPTSSRNARMFSAASRRRRRWYHIDSLSRMNNAARIRSRTAARDLHPRHHRWIVPAAPSRASSCFSAAARSGGGRDASARRRARLHRSRTRSHRAAASFSADAASFSACSARSRAARVASCASRSFLVSFRRKFATVFASFSILDDSARALAARARSSRSSRRAAASASRVSFLYLVSEATCAPMWSTPVSLALDLSALSEASSSLLRSAPISSGSFASFSTRAATVRRTPAARFRAFTGGE